MSELPALVGRKYRPIRLIGQGGMGLVSEVVHENPGEHLALKLLLARSRLAPDLVERFRREARATTAVKSNHVVRVTDADVAPELDGAPFLVMELLEGKNFGALPRAPTLARGNRGLAQTSRARSRQGSSPTHRAPGLETRRIYSSLSARTFPLSSRCSTSVSPKWSGGEGPETVSGRIVGTPRYMAPEQAGQSGNEISPASDRYALGLIAFRLLSKRHYFDEDNVMKLLLEVARGPTLAPSALGCRLGAAFDAWFARACSPEPKARFDSCSQQVEALAEALGLPVVAAPIGDSSRRNARGGRRTDRF